MSSVTMSHSGQVVDVSPVGRRRRSARAVTSFVGQVLAWSVVLGVVTALVTTVLVPRLAGATPYSILTSSMSPGLPAGTLVVVKPRPVSEIGIGDVVTYQLESGQPAVVTHRVVQVQVDARGGYLLTTQGDANDVADEQAVREAQVRGVRWYAVPYLGHLHGMISGPARTMTLVLAVAALLTYSGVMFAGAARERGRRRRSRREAVSR